MTTTGPTLISNKNKLFFRSPLLTLTYITLLEILLRIYHRSMLWLYYYARMSLYDYFQLSEFYMIYLSWILRKAYPYETVFDDDRNIVHYFLC